MQERDWLIPSVGLTVASALVALLFIPTYSGLIPAIGILPAWMAAAALIGSVSLLIRLILLRVASPIGELRAMAVRDRKKLAFITLAMAVAGANMIAFMWVKPLLNYLVPFRADPLLAHLDAALFFGHDPWTFLTWLNVPGAGLFYHQVWFVAIILTLLTVLVRPPSPEKSAVVMSYFVLWSLAGPLIHIVLPAVGPIFYEQMGYGRRFADLPRQAETAAVADFLWGTYASRQFGAGAGISAMPSMHVTMAAWMVIAFAVTARRGLVPIAVLAALVFAMSIALGWHYALDGVVGTAAATGCYLALRAIYRSRSTVGTLPRIATA